MRQLLPGKQRRKSRATNPLLGESFGEEENDDEREGHHQQQEEQLRHQRHHHRLQDPPKEAEHDFTTTAHSSSSTSSNETVVKIGQQEDHQKEGEKEEEEETSVKLHHPLPTISLFTTANLVSDFRSKILKGIRKHQRKTSSDSMNENLLEPLTSSPRHSSYGAVRGQSLENEQQEDSDLQHHHRLSLDTEDAKHAIMFHSTHVPRSSIIDGDEGGEETGRRRRKSLSDAHHASFSSDHHHHHRHRKSSTSQQPQQHRSSAFRRSSSIDARRLSRSSRRTSRVSESGTRDDECRDKDQDLEDMEDRFSVKPALFWIFVTFRKFLVKYWIWMVALLLMIMSVLGEKVVVFRICYMVLFLAFILTFQLSYRVWRRFLFPFLLIVMAYSLLVLMAVYTYQFATIRGYWKEYLGVSEKLQQDLGLKKFDRALSLFVELLTPTLFLLITFVQLKSFHKEFMDLTRDDDVAPSSSTGNQSTRRTTLQESTTGTASTPTDIKPNGTPSTGKSKRPSKKGSRNRSISRDGDAEQPQATSSNNLEVKIDMEVLSGDRSSEGAVGVTPETVDPNEQEVLLRKKTETAPVSPLVIGSPRMSERSVEFAPLSPSSTTPGGGYMSNSQHRQSTATCTQGESGTAGGSFSGRPSLLHRRKTLSEITAVKLTDVSLETAARDIRDRASNLWDTAKPGINELYELCWRFLEIHMMKAVFLSAFYVAIHEVSAVNFVFVFFTSIALPLARYEKLVTTIFAIWSASLILFKMLYQLSVASYFKHEDNCTYVYFAPSPDAPDYAPFNNQSALDYRAYLGFEEVPDIFPYIGKYLLILLVLTVNSVVTLRQRIHRQRFGLQSNPSKLLFMDGSRKNADQGLWQSIKFLLNYSFYKFGIEITILSIIVLIGSRMDVMSFVFSFWLFLLSLLRRKTVQCLWPFFTLFVTTIVPIQYLMSLGIPSVLCIEYPWYNALDPELRNWLFLPDFRIQPSGKMIFYDFIVLFLACRQWVVFNTESLMSLPQAAAGAGGGSNAETFYDNLTDQKLLKQQREEVPDFFNSGKSFLDHIKSYFFSCFYWVTLAVVFLTATGRTNLFGLGYILGCFFFLWNGSEFYLKPIRSIVRTWKFIIGYCALVIFLKTFLHVIGCVYSDILLNSSWCWISKLVGISCDKKLVRDEMDIRAIIVSDKGCTFTEMPSGLFWDGVCFFFLLIQKRIFGSYYFTYLVKDIKAQQVLASRGAELIHEIQAKEVMEQEEAEKDVMEKIKMKMDRIRAYQQGIKVGNSSRLPPERKSHRQEEDYGGISPYSTAEGSFTRSPVPDEEEAVAAGITEKPSLPTVYSPTPSPPTVMSPSSAASHGGKGYLEVYRVPIKHIDHTCSTSPTVPSMSIASSSSSPSPVDADLSVPSIHSNSPPVHSRVITSQPFPATITSLAAAAGLPFITSPLLDSAALMMSMGAQEQQISSGQHYTFKPYPTLRQQQQMFSRQRDAATSFLPSVVPASVATAPVLPTEQLPATQAIMSRPSFRLHQKPAQPLSRIASIRRKLSIRSTAASHGSVRSGDYYLFDDPASDDADLDLEEKPRKSMIPDPEGDELRRIANLRGISAFMSQLLKGELEPDGSTGPEPPLDREEHDTDIGESSKDSAIISVDREEEEPVDPDASMVTIITTIPGTEVASEKPSTSSDHESLKKDPRKSRDPGRGKEPPDDDAEEEVQDSEEDGSEAEKTEKPTISIWVKIIHWFTIFCWFIESCVISLTAKLNHVSRDYRYVSRRLAVEKRALKLMFEIEESEGVSYGTEWKRTTLEKISRATVPRSNSSDSVRRTKPKHPSTHIDLIHQQPSTSKQAVESYPPHIKVHDEFGQDNREGEEEGEEADSVTLINSNAFVRLFRSLFYTVVSQSEYACYAMVIFNQMANASLLSLPLPIMVFLWGCMSVPRPSKTFWISLITYTEAVVVAKYIVNFSVWPWVDYSEWKPQVVKTDDATKVNVSTHVDLALLLFLFFHRFMLKSLGLWDLDDSMEKSSERNSIDKALEGPISEDEEERQAKLYPKKIKAVKSKKVKNGKKVNKNEVEASVPPASTSSFGENVRKRRVNTHDPPETDPSGERIFETSLESSYKTSSSSRSTGEYNSDESPSDSEDDRGLCPEETSKVVRVFQSVFQTLDECKKPVEKFYHRLLHPPFRISHDLYTLMFVCDFVNFFIVVNSFNAFGSSTGESITKYFEDNKVPVPFLMMIITQFCSMVIDRALYLRKNIQLRLYFHVCLVVIIHIWLFFILPSVTERKFSDLNPPKFWYIFKCVYLLLSAVQVKGGYPTRILGNTFTKKYSYINLYLFKGYMLIPFLYDLRLIMDWIWTDTSLELDEWSIMEDIFKNLFQRKCELQFQASFPQFRGYPRQMYTKYMLGGAYLIMIIGAIWFPLVLFAVGGTVGSPNRPTDVSVEMEISGYVPIASLAATKVNATFLNETQYSQMLNSYKSKKEAVAFLSNTYDNLDTSIVKLNGNSTPVWGISPPAKKALIAELKMSMKDGDEYDIYFRTSLKISRAKQKGQTMDAEVSKSYDFTLTKETKQQLIHVLSREDTDDTDDPEDPKKRVKLEKVFPNFIRVPEKGELETIKQLEFNEHGFRDIYVFLKNAKNNTGIQWFEVKDICTKYNDPYLGFYRNDEHDCHYVLIMLINEKVFPGALGVISGYGILGLYTTFVFVVSRLIRGLFDDVSFKVIYSQLPNVDKVLQLCLDIYLVRESREFTLEEDLYAKLLFLYRSPETLIKWTKQLEEDQFEKQNIVIPPRE